MKTALVVRGGTHACVGLCKTKCCRTVSGILHFNFCTHFCRTLFVKKVCRIVFETNNTYQNNNKTVYTLINPFQPGQKSAAAAVCRRGERTGFSRCLPFSRQRRATVRPTSPLAFFCEEQSQMRSSKKETDGARQK